MCQSRAAPGLLCAAAILSTDLQLFQASRRLLEPNPELKLADSTGPMSSTASAPRPKPVSSFPLPAGTNFARFIGRAELRLVPHDTYGQSNQHGRRLHVQVSEIMTKDIVACRPEDTLKKAASLMGEQDCGALPVLDGREELIGVLTDRDICLCAADRDEPLANIQVADAISWEPLTCRPDEKIESAERKLSEHQVRRLPVIDESGKLLGMLSLGDIARAQADSGSPTGAQKKLAATIAAISRPTKSSRLHA